MKNKVYTLITCSLMISFFLFPPTKLLLCDLGVMSITKIGNEFNPNLQDDESWYTPIYNTIETVKMKLNDLYCNYLPYYNDLVALYGTVENTLNEPVYLLLDVFAKPTVISVPDQPDVSGNDTLSAKTGTETATEIVEEYDPDKIIDFKSRYLTQDATHRYYMFTAEHADGRKTQALERVTLEKPEVLHARMENCMAEMVRVTEYLATVPDVYVYSGSRFQDSPVLTDYLPDEYCTQDDRDMFLEALSPYASVGYLHLDSMNDRFHKMFLTDHHWNAEGMREGYYDIHAMIRENWPEISDINEPTLYTVEGIKHYGSFARLSNTYTVSEGFTFYDYNLAEHSTGGGSVEDSKQRYLAKQYDNSRGVAHYESFYPHPERIKYPENNTGRNLLVIGDSFSRGFVEYIGSHFDTTIVRPIWNGTDYDLEKAIARYKITDVVILLYSDRMMYDLYGDFRTDKLLTPVG